MRWGKIGASAARKCTRTRYSAVCVALRWELSASLQYRLQQRGGEGEEGRGGGEGRGRIKKNEKTMQEEMHNYSLHS